MTADPPREPKPVRQPTRSPSPAAGADERQQRLAAALRDNLRRRKAQQRERDDVDPKESDERGG
jgi:hypothetical protein